MKVRLPKPSLPMNFSPTPSLLASLIRRVTTAEPLFGIESSCVMPVAMSVSVIATGLKATGLSSSTVTEMVASSLATPSLTLTGMLKDRRFSPEALAWSSGLIRSSVQLPSSSMATSTTLPAEVEPTSALPSPLTCQLTVRPPEVRPGVTGTPSVTVWLALSTSVMVIWPEAWKSLVVSVGLPVVSAFAPESPSSETTAVSPVTTGASFAPKIEIVSVEAEVRSPSVAV